MFGSGQKIITLGQCFLSKKRDELIRLASKFYSHFEKIYAIESMITTSIRQKHHFLLNTQTNLNYRKLFSKCDSIHCNFIVNRKFQGINLKHRHIQKSHKKISAKMIKLLLNISSISFNKKHCNVSKYSTSISLSVGRQFNPVQCEVCK